MQTTKQYINNFFRDHKTSLQKDYPGLNQNRLELEFKNFCSHNETTGPEILSSYFYEESNSRSQHFFFLLRKGVPLEYITGEAYFYNFPLWVDRRVLIPRKETEILVEEGLKYLHSKSNEGGAGSLEVVDVGTGPGTILLGIAQNYNGKKALNVLGIDDSNQALRLAQNNMDRLRFGRNSQVQVALAVGDRLSKTAGKKFDLILTNPPYIMESEKGNIHPQVLRYEPAHALFLEDGIYMTWFEDFFGQIKNSLKDDGLAIMEGSENHLQALNAMATKLGLDSSIKKDYNEADRFLILNLKR